MTLLRLLALMLLLWMPCSSESDWTLVTGIVTDKRGNELPQAVVQLEDQSTLFVRSYITDADGRYHFSGINPETDYTLKARYGKHWSKPHLVSRFDSPKHHNVHLIIPVD